MAKFYVCFKVSRRKFIENSVIHSAFVMATESLESVKLFPSSPALEDDLRIFVCCEASFEAFQKCSNIKLK